jgi:hypothetical protein
VKLHALFKGFEQSYPIDPLELFDQIKDGAKKLPRIARESSAARRALITVQYSLPSFVLIPR